MSTDRREFLGTLIAAGIAPSLIGDGRMTKVRRWGSAAVWQ